MVLAYLQYLIKSKNEHGIHSPFVYELYTEVLKSKNKSECFQAIEQARNIQLKNNEKIEITDFGAGSKHNQSKHRKISEIAKNAEKPKQFGELLFHLIQYFKPKTAFDLGTSLGITTLYQAKAAEKFGHITSFEGCPETANLAKNLFESFQQKNIKQIIGNIDETLTKELAQIDQLDFVFFDANHRYLPTLNYFNLCLQKATEDAVFVFDDIHWSTEMEQAWAEIKTHEQVLLTIDLFYIGLVFFRKKQVKQHFTLRL